MQKNIIFLVIILLTSCTLRPLYGTLDHNASCALSQVDFTYPINSEEARALARHLDVYLNGYCRQDLPKKYTLTANVKKNEVGVLFIKTGEATRKTIVLNAHLKLVNNITGKVLIEEMIENTDSYSNLDSPYNEYITRRNSVDNAALGLSTIIVNKLLRALVEEK
ncbi:MAG: hypothetical protein J0H68_00805 [Sphingobacteriia bacterium]|nr:hypothetical protein [Sphingobacteriia bacterium]